MTNSELARLEADEAELTKTIKKAEAELERYTETRSNLKKAIERLKKNVSGLESKGPKIVALAEYKRMRVEAVQKYRELAALELNTRAQTKLLKDLCRDLKSTQDSLRSLRKPRSL